MSTATAERDPIVAPESDRSAIASIDRALEREVPPGVAQLISPDGDQIELPASLYAVLSRAAHELSRGRGVAILSVGTELTTQRAADLLNVSRPFLIQMLEQGEVPFHMVGTHRRIRLEDVLAYRRSRSEGRRQALRQLTEEAQELDIYEP